MKLLNDKKFAQDINKHNTGIGFFAMDIKEFREILSKHTKELPEEKKDEREMVGMVCQGCQELEASCDCMSEKERNAYNTCLKNCEDI